MFSKFKKALVGVGVAATTLMVSGVAMAEPTFEITPPDIDYVALGSYASSILAALAAVWVIRKFIKITNRS